MSNRHLARSVVLQTLFEWDVRSYEMDDALHALARNEEEFAPGMGDSTFTQRLLKGVHAKRSAIDSIIVKAAPDWPLEKISIIDRNILRVGLFELLFSDRGEVPAKVAINESIELAKTYGGENSGKFVNGVLGSVYKELGEPGKDESAPKRKEIPTERLGGALVFAKDGGEIYVALVHDIFGHWTLSKGHLEEGEEEVSGAARVVSEEIGIPVRIVEPIGKNEYVASHPEKGKIRKSVSYYLAEATHEDLKLAETGGLDDAKWFRLRDILDLNFYNDILPIVTRAVNALLGPAGTRGGEKA
jgi:transcription antitermination protein NusB